MSKTVQWKRGNANVSSAYIGAQGEITVDTSEWSLRVHDGLTPGGYKINNDTDGNVNVGNLNINDQTIQGKTSNQDVQLVATGAANVVLFGQATVVSNDIYVQGNGVIDGISIQNSTISTVDPSSNLILTSGNVSTSGNFYANILRLKNENFYIAEVFSGALGRNITSIFSGLSYPEDITIRANNSVVGLHTSAAGTVGLRTFASNSSTIAVTIGGNTQVQGNVTANGYSAPEYSGYTFSSNTGTLSGIVHRELNANINILAVLHDNFEVARFFSNNQTQMVGNVIITGGIGVSNQQTFPEARIQVYSNVNSYSQIVHQNLNPGDGSSSDYVATADNGDDSSHYIAMGIASSNYAIAGFDVIGPNDSYLYSVGNSYLGPVNGTANLNLGSTNGSIKTWIGQGTTANVVTVVDYGQFSVTGNILPRANVTYNLGSATNQWKDLWLSNNTLYLGGTPITVANGVLSVNGSPVSGTGNYSNANVAAYLPVYSGNVSANNFIGNIQGNIQGLIGSITNLDSGNFNVENIGALVANVGVNIGAGGYNNLVVLPTDVIIQNVPLTVAGNILSTVAGGLHITANTVANGTAQTWNFGTDGRLTFPGTPRIATDTNNFEVQAAENINFEANAAFNIYTDTSGGTYQWQFDTTGNLTVPGTIFVPSGASITGTGSPAPRMSGFSSIEAASFLSGSGNVTVRASYGNLRIGDVGNVGSSNAGITSSTTFSIVTDNVGTPHEWVFDANGEITAPGNITSTTGNVLVKNIRTIDQEVHLGQGAGQSSQGAAAIAIGRLAGNTSQGAAAVAIGEQAGNITQGSQSIAIGTVAGQSNQGTDAIAIGTSAGGFNQREGAVAIGQSAGVIDQGVFAVAIGSGAGYQYQANNSIAITATGTQLSPTESGFYIDPVRSMDGSNVSLSYNTSTKEITYSANTFVSNTYVPSTAGSAGTIGQISFDGSYVYVCVANNTWRRANLSSW